MAALESGQSVIIDSSLRDLQWWRQVIASIRDSNPLHSVGLLQVVADTMTIFKRAAKRGRQTGRIIPFDTLIASLQQTPRSVRALRPLVDFFLRYDLNGAEPQLIVQEIADTNAVGIMPAVSKL